MRFSKARTKNVNHQPMYVHLVGNFWINVQKLWPLLVNTDKSVGMHSSRLAISGILCMQVILQQCMPISPVVTG